MNGEILWGVRKKSSQKYSADKIWVDRRGVNMWKTKTNFLRTDAGAEYEQQ